MSIVRTCCYAVWSKTIHLTNLIAVPGYLVQYALRFSEHEIQGDYLDKPVSLIQAVIRVFD